MIVIFSERDDSSTAAVLKHLSAAKQSWVRLDAEDFGRTFFISLFFNGNERFFRIYRSEGVLDSRAITSIWNWRLVPPTFLREFNSVEYSFSYCETFSFLSGLPAAAGPRWINDFDADMRSSNKSHQLRLAATLGFRVPTTLISNYTEDVRSFSNSVGETIFKTISGVRPFPHNPNGPDNEISAAEQLTFTNVLTAKHMEQISAISFSPAQFQEHIRKRADVRVTYIDGECFACRIYSQEREDTKIDFRRMMISGGPVRHETFELPSQEVKKIEHFMKSSGLVLGCFDLIETMDEEFVFLELNPSGGWLWIEDLTGQPIAAAIARTLARNS